MSGRSSNSVLRFTVPYSMLVSDNARLQPVTRRSGIPSVTLSDRYKAKKEAIGYVVRSQWKGGRYDGPMRAEFRVWLKPKSRLDCSNLFKATIDAMEGIVVENDRQFVDVRVVQESRSERKDPRLEAVVAPPESEVWT